MGIINATPDSFYAPSRSTDADAMRRRVEAMIEEGADMIDVGACSTRPGASVPDEDEELRRLDAALSVIRPLTALPISVDTFRAEVARQAVENMGADIVNDISGGLIDPAMVETVVNLRCPYILTHMRGTPATMQSLTDYPNGVFAGVLAELSERVAVLSQAGVADLIIDPGFGFAKTLEQNYKLLAQLPKLSVFGLPILVGISRKSMITKLLDIEADQALEATTALNSFALDRGASILRVHDVRACRQAIDIYTAIQTHV